MTTDSLQSLRTTNKHFVTRLMGDFGLDLSDLNDARIDQLEEPTKKWLLWALYGFERAEATYSYVHRFSPRVPGRHLDVGCGTGYLSATFAKHGFESVGIDIGDLGHARLQQLDFPDSRLSFLNMDLLKDDTASLGLFDVITLDNTIEHIELPSVMISRLRSLLAKDGVIYLIIPNSHWIDTVRADPHYAQFGISLLDKLDGDALLAAVTDDYTTYEVNNWFCRYRIDQYEALFRRYGFMSSVCYPDVRVDDEQIERMYASFDLATTTAEFRSELAKLESKLTRTLFAKLKLLIEIYLAQLENDYRLAVDPDDRWASHYRFDFAQTYLFGTWFMLLRPMTDPPPHLNTTIASRGEPAHRLEEERVKHRDAWLLCYCLVGGFVVYAPILGQVFPEYAYFYRDFGLQGRPTLTLVLQSFVSLSGGWYRPVSITLAPYLLGVDFLNPSSVVAMNIVFLALAAFLAPTLLLPTRAGLGARLVTASLILSAPSLQSVTYLPTIDALYILFSVVAIAALDRAYREDASLLSWRFGIAVLALVAAACSKEIAVLVPFVAVPFIMLRRIAEGAKPSWALMRKVTWFCAPLAAGSVAFYLAYLSQRGMYSAPDSYSSVPGQESLRRLVQLVGVSLNLRFQDIGSGWLRWATGGYDALGSGVRAVLYLVALAYGAFLVYTRRHWLVAAYGIVLLTITVPLGVFAIHSHHAFAVIVALALGVGAACAQLPRALAVALRQGEASRMSVTLAAVLLVGASVILLQRAYTQSRDVLTTGLHGFQFRYNTALFHDDRFREVVAKRPSFVMIVKCPNAWSVGSEAGVLNYFARSRNALGEAYVDDLGAAKVVEAMKALEPKGGQLIGLGCNYAHSSIPQGGGRPYSIVDLSGGMGAITGGQDIGVSQHQELYRHVLLGKGWHDVERDLVWSAGREATIEVPVAASSRTITLSLGAFVPQGVRQTVEVKIDGTSVGTLSFDAANSRATVSWPISGRPFGTVRVEFNISNPLAPKAVGVSDDPRELGIAVHGLRVE